MECKKCSAPGERGKRASSPPLVAAGLPLAVPWTPDVCM